MSELVAGDCNACIWSGDYEQPDFYSSKIVKARKQHVCLECKDVIHPGFEYERVAGKWEGSMEAFKTCLVCVEIRKALCCEGWCHGLLWFDAKESMFPALTTGCLSKLTTAAAKAKLLTEWRKWKGLTP